MNRKIYQGSWKNRNGDVIADGSVTVYLAGTTTLATIYADDTTATAVTGSVVTSGTNGHFYFYVDESDYLTNQLFKIVLTKAGYSSSTYDDISILTNYNGSASEVYPEMFGATSGGVVDSTSEIQSFFDYGKNRPVTLRFNGLYAVSETIILKQGTYKIDMGETQDISVSNAKYGLVWIGGNDDVVLELQRPDACEFKSINILNNPLLHTGLLAVLIHNPDDSGTAAKSNHFGSINLAGTKYGLRMGDYTNDGYDSNFDDNQIDRILTYNVANPILIDSSAQDDLLFGRALLGTGPYSPAALVEQRDYMIKVLRNGNNLKFVDLFLRLDGIENDAKAVDIDSGNIEISSGSVEGGGVSNCQVFSFTQSSGRNQNIIRNFSLSAGIKNSSGYSATFSAANGTILDGVNWSDGNVLVTCNVEARNNSFVTGSYFVESGGSADLIAYNPRFKASVGAVLEGSTPLGNVQFNYVYSNYTYLANTLVCGRDFTSASFTDTTDISIIKIFLGPTDTNDGSHVSVRIDYHFYESALEATNLSAGGSVYYDVCRDKTTHITMGTPYVVANTGPALDGYSSIAVTASISEDETDDFVLLKIAQNNNQNTALRGTFTIYIQGSTCGLNSRSVRIQDIDLTV